MDFRYSPMADRCAGALLGLAAGDRIGGPIRMAVQLAESLADARRIDREDVAARYLAWWRADGFDTGMTAQRVFERVIAGQSFADAAAQTHVEAKGLTAGCNPAHRAAGLAMLQSIPDADLPAAAIDEANLTHTHPLAADVSAAAVVLRRALIQGVPWDQALSRARTGRLEETAAALNPANFKRKAGGFAPDTLAATVYFLSEHDDFAAALTASLRFAGPPNYAPVLLGSVGGARWGAEAITADLLSHCDILPHVRAVADRLARGW